MKASLQGIVGEGADLMNKNSLTVAEGLIRKSVESEVERAFAPDAMRQRLGASAEAFVQPNLKEKEDHVNEQLRNALATDIQADKSKETQPPYCEKGELLTKQTLIN